MEAALRQLLTEFEEAGRRHDAQEQDRSRKMLNLEPATCTGYLGHPFRK